jgi:hypothetical protein
MPKCERASLDPHGYWQHKPTWRLGLQQRAVDSGAHGRPEGEPTVTLRHNAGVESVERDFFPAFAAKDST